MALSRSVKAQASRSPFHTGSCESKTANSSGGIITGLRTRRGDIDDRVCLRDCLGRPPVPRAGPRRPRRPLSGCAEGCRKRWRRGLSSMESLSSLSSSSPGPESHSTPNCSRYLRGRTGERSKLKRSSASISDSEDWPYHPLRWLSHPYLDAHSAVVDLDSYLRFVVSQNKLSQPTAQGMSFPGHSEPSKMPS